MDSREWLKSLTDAQQKALYACGSSEEVVRCCKEQGIALPEELLDGVTGGLADYCEVAPPRCWDCDRRNYCPSNFHPDKCGMGYI